MTRFRRDDLAQIGGMSPRLLAAFEEQDAAVEQTSNDVADTQALKDATVIVLSANGDFTNERVLQISDDIEMEITESTVKLKVKNVARTQDFGATLIPPAEVELFLPAEGTLISDVTLAALFATLGNYANDAAAAGGGVAVGALYRNASQVMVRVT